MHTEVRRTKSAGIKVTNVENGERGGAVSLALCPVKGIVRVCVCVWLGGIRFCEWTPGTPEGMEGRTRVTSRGHRGRSGTGSEARLIVRCRDT